MTSCTLRCRGRRAIVARWLPSGVIPMHMLRSTLFLAIVCACGACKPESTTPVAQAPASAPAVAPHAGVDLAGIDHAVQPGDDFDGYANGAWRAKAVIPEDRSSTGVGFEVFQKAEKRNADLIQGLAASQSRRGHRRRARSATTTPPSWTRPGSRSAAWRRCSRSWTRSPRSPAPPIWRACSAKACAPTSTRSTPPTSTPNSCSACSSRRAWKIRSTTSPYLLQGGLGMPNRDYYLSADPEMVAIRDKYQAYVAGDAEARRHRRRRQQGRRRSSRSKRRSPRRTPRSSRPRTCTRRTIRGRWRTSPRRRRASTGRRSSRPRACDAQPVVIAWQPGAITELSALVASRAAGHLEGLPAPSTRSTATPACCRRPSPTCRFAFYGTTLTGTPQQRDRWKRAHRRRQRRARRRGRQALRAEVFPGVVAGEGAADGRRTCSPPSTSASTSSTG